MALQADHQPADSVALAGGHAKLATTNAAAPDAYAVALTAMSKAPSLPGNRLPAIRPDILSATSYYFSAQGLLIHPSDVFSITATPCMRWVLTGGADGIIRKWDFFASINGKVPLTSVQRQGQVDSVVKSGVLLSQWPNETKEFAGPEPDESSRMITEVNTPTSNVATTANDTAVSTPNAADTKAPVTTKLINSTLPACKPQLSPVYSLAVHSEAVWALSGLETGAINLYSIRHEEGHCHHVLKQHTLPVSALQITPDEQGVWSGSWDKSVCEWDLNTGTVVHSFNEHVSQISSLSLRPLPSAQQSNSFDTLGQQGSSSAMNIDTTDPTVVLSSSIDGICLLWDRRQATPARRLLPSDKCPPWCISACWSADGRRVYAGRRHGAVDEWDIAENKPVRTLRFPNNSGPVSHVNATINGRHLLCASTDNIRLWDLEAPTDAKTVPFRIIPGHHGGIISHLYLDPCNRFLISTSGNRGWEGSSNRACLFYEVKGNM
ncbi:WD40-repeat-containing domain protein [Syncephalis fuscata]|nr:WD40-repeat-containing domain protein [Syncephalis fuscata]